MSMDALDFVKTYQRVCKAYSTCSKGCPLHAGDDVCMMVASAQDTVDIVEKWAEKHPVKTRQSEFLKQWPNAEFDAYGAINICPKRITGETPHNNGRRCDYGCIDCHREFWSQEVE